MVTAVMSMGCSSGATFQAYLPYICRRYGYYSARLGPRVEALNDAVVETFGKLKDGAATDLVAKNKAIKALRSDVGAKFVSSGPLALVADIDAWLKANPPPVATPPQR